MVKVPLIFDAPIADAAPVKPPVTTGTDQLYVVPAGTIPLVPSVGVEVNNTPLHVVALIALMLTPGLTVTVNTNDAFTPQLTEAGVTV